MEFSSFFCFLGDLFRCVVTFLVIFFDCLVSLFVGALVQVLGLVSFGPLGAAPSSCLLEADEPYSKA